MISEQTTEYTDGAEGLDLRGWCTTDSERPTWMQQPFQIARKIWATDGQAAIYVNLDSEQPAPRPAGVANMEMTLSDVSKVRAWIPLPDAELARTTRLCRTCEGKGLGPLRACDCCGVVHHCGQCVVCDGEGKYPQADPVLTPSGYMAWRYYALLRALPQVEIGVLDSWECLEDSVIHFRFLAGGGKVMGVKWAQLRDREKTEREVLETRRALFACEGES